MHTVEKIAVDENHRQYYLIDIKNEKDKIKQLNVHEDTLVAFGLHKGLELEEDQMAELEKMTREEAFYQAAVNYLSYRIRSIREMKQYLLKKEATPEQAEAVIGRCLESGMLDDNLFAEMFVRNRIQTSNKGPGHIRRELETRGVAASIIESQLAMYSEDEQKKHLNKLVDKKAKQLTGKKSQSLIRQQVIQFSLGKGFPPELVHETVNERLAEKPVQNEDEEWTALQKQGMKAVRKYEHEDKYMRNNKIRQFLYRKGFKSDLIGKFIDELPEAEE